MYVWCLRHSCCAMSVCYDRNCCGMYTRCASDGKRVSVGFVPCALAADDKTRMDMNSHRQHRWFWRGAKKAVPASLSSNEGREMCSCGDVSGAINGVGKAQARTCVNTLQRRPLHSESKYSYRRTFSLQNAVRRVVQNRGGHFSSSHFHVKSSALAVARCSFWQILPASFASAGMF